MDKHKAAFTTDARRRDTIRGLIEAGHSPEDAAMVVDMAFQATDRAVAAFQGSLELLKHDPGLYFQSMIIAGQIVAVEFNNCAEALVDFTKDLSMARGIEPRFIRNKESS